MSAVPDSPAAAGTRSGSFRPRAAVWQSHQRRLDNDEAMASSRRVRGESRSAWVWSEMAEKPNPLNLIRVMPAKGNLPRLPPARIVAMVRETIAERKL